MEPKGSWVSGLLRGPLRWLLLPTSALGILAAPLLSQTLPDSAALADSAVVLWNMGWGAYEEGTREGMEEAIRAWRGELKLRKTLGDLPGQASALGSLGKAFSALGEPDSALVNYRQALAITLEIGDPQGEGGTLNNIGLVYERLGQADSALAYYWQALPISREVGDRSGEAITLNNIGAVYSGLGQPDSTLAYYRRALPIFQEIGDRRSEGIMLGNIGAMYNGLGQPDSALYYHRQALASNREFGDLRGEATTLSSIGAVYYGLGQPDSALAYHRQALPIRRETGDRRGEGITLSSIGGVYDGLGQPDSALAYYRQALPIQNETGDRRGEGTTLNSLAGLLDELGQPDSALFYYAQSLSVRREVGNRRGEGITLNNISLVYSGIGQPDSALAYSRQALPIIREVRDRRGEGTALSNIGAAYGGLGQPDSALVYYHLALPIRRETGDRTGEGNTLSNIGLVYNQLGQPDSALAYYKRALPIVREVGDRLGEGATLGNLGHLFQYWISSPRPSQAVAYYDSATAVRGTVAGAAGGDANRLSFSEEGASTFHLWSLAWLARSEEVGRSTTELSALAASERGRGQALLELMRDSLFIEPGRDLAAEADSLLEAVTKRGAAGLSYMVTQDTLLAWLIQPSGDVQVTRTPVHRDTLAVLVEHFRRELGVDERSTRTRLVREGPELERVQLRSEIVGAQGPAGAWPGDAALRLGALLLPPDLQAQLPESGELVLVPHSALNLIPFTALPLGSTQEALGERYAVRYTPSLAILEEAEGRFFGPGGPLIVGNPEMPEVTTADGDREQLSPLRGAEAEAEWLAEAIGFDPLTGTEATETAVRAKLPGASMVHLATHGFAYSSAARARDSFVALAPDETHDGLLRVGEVLDEVGGLSADLVVLSACQTGLGDLKQAEGTVGLQRAFLARGARSVLVSLWSVSDEATELLMRRFYAHWRGMEGEEAVGKAEALRRAQADVRSTEGYEHPRFWAAFQLVGAW